MIHTPPDDSGEGFMITIRYDNKSGAYGDRTYCNYWGSGELSSQTPYIDGKFHGALLRYSNPGVMDYYTQYAYDKKDGIDRHYDQYGHIMSKTNYTNGIRDGLDIDYYYGKNVSEEDMGKVSIISKYIDGVRRYQKNYEKEGFLSYEVYRDASGLKDGEEDMYAPTNGVRTRKIIWNHGIIADGYSYFSYYYPSGNLQSKYSYLNGKKNGMSYYYYDSGSLGAEYPYVDGKKDGNVKYYKENGDLEQCDIFDKGERVGNCMP
jgi:antitoxin component YwqK of YwqJK toxin-antitoxin module